MGLLDDAIREHLDLQRRRGADPTDIERAEREALGPVRREPTMSSTSTEEPPASPTPAPVPPPDVSATSPVSDPEPATADQADEHDEWDRVHDAEPDDEPFDFVPPEAATEAPAHEPENEDPTVVAAPASEEFEHEFEPEPAPKKRRGLFGRRLGLGSHDDTEDDDPENKRDPIESVRRVPASRRPGVQPEPDEEPFYDESYEEPEEFEGHPVQQHEPESSLNVGHDAHTVEYDVEGHFREEDEADEHILEETPDFLADTPDHDRLWFEQKPPPDFDFE